MKQEEPPRKQSPENHVFSFPKNEKWSTQCPGYDNALILYP